jgi:TolA-binding protein
MFFRFSVPALLIVLGFSGPATAQQPTAHDKSQDSRIDELAKQLGALTTRVTTAESNIGDINRRISELTTNVTKLTEVVADIDSRLKSLSDKVNELSDKPSSELTAMKTQLDAISVKDGESYVPNISAAMTSNRFRQDMETAVNKSLKTAGTVLLTNKTAIAQWVEINRTRYFLRPGEQLPVAVNIGTVTTELPGEEMQTWTITAPAYQLALEIVPKPELAAAVPVTAAYPAMPLTATQRYVSPPLVGAPIPLGSTSYLGPTEVAYR